MNGRRSCGVTIGWAFALSVPMSALAKTPPTSTPFRGPLIAIAVSNQRGVPSASLEGAAASVGMITRDVTPDWAADCPPSRTCFRIFVAGPEPAESPVYQVFAKGVLTVTDDGGTRVSAERFRSSDRAYRLGIESLKNTVQLSLRPSAPPRIELTDGFGWISKGLGARNEGRFDGEVSFEIENDRHLLVFQLRWHGQRLFGWAGAKSRTLRIPVQHITKISRVRQASMQGDRVVLGDAQVLDLEWKVPPNAKARAQRRPYSLATARLAAKIPPTSRAQLGLFDFLIRRRTPTGVRQACCYADSSLSAFLRFNRSATPGAERCAASRRCTKEELEWLAK